MNEERMAEYKETLERLQQLEALCSRAADEALLSLLEYKETLERVERLKALCAQAAEVLEILGYKGPVVTELRKAAE